MFNKLLNYRLASLVVIVKRSINVQSNFDLGSKMKILNDKKQFEEALKLFNKYKEKNIETFSSSIITQALKACAQINDLQLGSAIHSLISSRIKNDPYILTSLINLYMKCNKMTLAQSLFEKSTNKTLFMYGAMMKGYIHNNLPNKAIELFHDIKHPDEVIILTFFNACAELKNNEALDLIKKISSKIPKTFYSNSRLLASLFDALIKCGDCSTAEILFSKIKKSIISYGNLMNGFNKENNPEKTLNLFYQMKIDDIAPNLVIYLCVIKALAQLGVFPVSHSIVQQIPNSFLFDHKIQNTLIDMWGKIGYVNEAKQIFEKMSQPDQITYTAMINGYGLNGMGIQAIELFRQMPSEYIDEAVFICALNACSHSGLVNEARSIFVNIQNKTGKIYTTMIDCLSRASFFEEAQKLIDEFERHHSPVWPMYMALLSGARNEKNVHLSQQIFDRMKKIFPELTDPLIAAAVLVGNSYASSGKIENASAIRIQLDKSGLKKKIGLSWTSVNGKLFRFRAHDQSHPRSSEIYAELDKMSNELIKHGHKYDASWITRPLNEDETVASALCGHSERLAIAWNFVENPDVSRIHVSKNLRVCGDCHRATKLLAAIRQCEIIVRDANRIHHFHVNGQYKSNINDYSTWFSSTFRQQNRLLDKSSIHELEIPGQYTSKKKPLLEHHIKIVGFDEKLLVLHSLRLPKRLTIRGHDENDYRFLVKGGEDIRQDQRIEALFSIMNDLYDNDPNCNQSNSAQISVRTYKVIPMSSKLGIIEWLDNTRPLKDLIEESYNDAELDLITTQGQHPRKLYQDYVTNTYQKAKPTAKTANNTLVYAELFLSLTKAQVQEEFNQIQSVIPADLLRRAYYKIANSHEGFYTLRRQFITSYAVLCTSQYILGIGDRHQSNFLIDTSSGQIIGIDFGSAFNAATIHLPVPELIPIRLTRQLTQLMSPIGTAGLFRATMIHTMNALRENSDLLLSTMDVFIKEPLMEWMEHALKTSKQVTQNETNILRSDDTYAKDRIKSARLKLNGINPAVITGSDLKLNSFLRSSNLKEARRQMEKIVGGDQTENRRAQILLKYASHRYHKLTVDEQIDCIIDQATDVDILGRSWAGLETFI